MAGIAAPIAIVVYGIPRNTAMRNAVAPITGGVIAPWEAALASTAAATCGVNPVRFMAGIVIVPVLSTLLTPLPLSMPYSPLAQIATFAEPPRT
jgi:hypothetical protein